MTARENTVAAVAIAATVVLAAGMPLAMPAASAAATNRKPRPDLVVSAVAVPAGAPAPGSAVAWGDTTRNAGAAASRASATVYYLSADAVKGAGDLKLGTRKVPGLGQKGGSKGSVRLVVPAIAAGRSLFLIACADGAAKVVERSERNNCRASTRALAVSRPVVAGGTPPVVAPPTPSLSDADHDGTQDASDCGPLDDAVHPGAADRPDLTFTDANCDGIDGDEVGAVFVAAAPSGASDTNPGTKAQPLLTLARGIEVAAAAGKDVYVAAGVFSERLSVRSGVDVFGGYDAAGWSRSRSNVTTISRTGTPNTALEGVTAIGVRTPTTLQLLRVVAGDAVAPGTSSYGVRAQDSGGLSLQAVTVLSGIGARGQDRAAGSPGSAGGAGGPGLQGWCDAGAGAGGTAGLPGAPFDPPATPQRGGKGGNGGPEGANAGANGEPGGGGDQGGSGGAGGTRGGAGANGFPGAPANGPGQNGTAGSGGEVVAGLWQTAAGTTGGTGAPGAGGGGGGGGGGQGGMFINAGGGNGGGGGGAGGNGGSGGSGGSGAGGSFGVFLVNSDVTIADSTITSTRGGDGGNGAAGGNGGRGGNGGLGAATCPNEIGQGGNGGVGGAGSAGGVGGGGAGGPSYAIFKVGSTPNLSSTTLSFGNGGAGGTAAGGNAGAVGHQGGQGQS